MCSPCFTEASSSSTNSSTDISLKRASQHEMNATSEPSLSSTLSLFRSATMVGVLLSVFAYYAIQRGGDVAVTQQTAMLPYVLLGAFMYHIARNIGVDVYILAKKKWTAWSKGGNLTTTFSSQALQSLSSNQALSRLSQVSSTVSKSICHSFQKYNRRSALQALTRKECFAKIDYIELLSISDIIMLFRYVSKVNQKAFSKKVFMKEVNQAVRAVVTAMDMAVTVSRGSSTAESRKHSQPPTKGALDALYFVAVVRVFAEWRTMRLVPKGYKRYDVALNLAYRDVLQNLVKIENGVHLYLKVNLQQQERDPSRVLVSSPTLRELLQWEVNAGMHPRLPKVKEQSVASGLLWGKRQLHYQISTFEFSLKVPFEFPSGKAAAIAAYKEVYDKYHGWAVKQVFQHSFGGSPPIEKIWKAMIPPVRQFKKDGELSEEKAVYESNIEREDHDEPMDEFLLALEGFGKDVGTKWDDLISLFNCGNNCGNNKEKRQKSNGMILSSESYLELAGVDASALLIDRAPSFASDSEDTATLDPLASAAKRATKPSPAGQVKKDAENFVQELRPLLEDLGILLEEFNMNDPTRV